MARVIIETAGEDVIVGGDDVVVNGTASGSETVTIVGGNVTLDASFAQGGDTIILAGDASGYTATRVGSRLILTNGTTTISIPLSPNETEIEFGDGDVRTLSLVDGEIVLGGQVLDGEGETVITPPEDTSLLDALAALQDAEEDLADFLDDEETDADTIRDAVDEAEADLADDVEEDGSYAQLQAQLQAAEAYADAAEEDMAAVPGLEEAREAYFEADEAMEPFDEALNEAWAVRAGATAEFEVANGTAITEDSLWRDQDGDWNGQITADGDVVVYVEDGELVVDEDWEDAARIDVLLDGVEAVADAQADWDAAEEARWQAYNELSLLDQVIDRNDEVVDRYTGLLEDFFDALETMNEEMSEEEEAQPETEAALEDAFAALFGEEEAPPAEVIYEFQDEIRADIWDVVEDEAGDLGELAYFYLLAQDYFDAMDTLERELIEDLPSPETEDALEDAFYYLTGEEMSAPDIWGEQQSILMGIQMELYDIGEMYGIYTLYSDLAEDFTDALEALNAEVEEEDVTDATIWEVERAFFYLSGESVDAEEIWEDQDEILEDLAAMLASFEGEVEMNDNPLLDDWYDSREYLAYAEGEIGERDDLLAALEDAEALLAVLEDHEQDIEDAQDAFEALGYEVPVTVGDADYEATNGSDVYVYVGADGWTGIEEFGEDGNDVIYVGEGYNVIRLGEDESVGEDELGAFDELDIFIEQIGDDTFIYIEHVSYAGNEADGDSTSQGDGEFAGGLIRLFDFDADDVVVNADGTITLDTGAEAAAGWQSIAADNGFA